MHTPTDLHIVDLPAGQIAFADHGAGRPVVFLHGLFMDHTLWDPVLTHLPPGIRSIRPILPLGAHTIPLHDTATDRSIEGLAHLVADFLDALELTEVTLVHSDWGGGLLLTDIGRDQRIASLVVLPCEAFDNFPPGLPGRLSVLAARLPGGIWTSAWNIRLGLPRRSPAVFGWMAARPIPGAMARGWTAPALADPRIRGDVRRYVTSTIDKPALVRATEALGRFTGRALVIWTQNRVMPMDHGRRLAELLRTPLVLFSGASVLVSLDAPARLAAAIGDFVLDTGSGTE